MRLLRRPQGRGARPGGRRWAADAWEAGAWAAGGAGRVREAGSARCTPNLVFGYIQNSCFCWLVTGGAGAGACAGAGARDAPFCCLSVRLGDG